MARASEIGGGKPKPKSGRSIAPKSQKKAKNKLRVARVAEPPKDRSVAEAEAEVKELLRQQAATAEILRVINAFQGDLKPVFETILVKAHSLCDVPCGSLQLIDGDYVREVAVRGQTEAFEKFLRQGYRISDRVRQDLNTGQITHADMAELLVLGEPSVRAAVELGRIRTFLAIPLANNGVTFGRIVAARQEVRPFTDRQIGLLKAFADQAVIAIENARLFNEVQAKTRDLEESLQQQTATADVLKAISRSAFDLETVLATVLATLVESAAKLVGADQGTIARKRGDVFYREAFYGFSSTFRERILQIPIVPERGSASGRALLEGIPIHVVDVHADPEYTLLGRIQVDEFSTILGVPMLRDGAPIGIMALTRNIPRAFTDKEIALATTFADQAAIAIENVRLFEQVQARTRDLEQALDELRAAQDRLVQTEKLASLGQLTAGIAHEIKNPLNFVNNFSALSSDLVEEMNEVLDKTSLDQTTRGEIDEISQMLKSNLEKVLQHGKRADSIVKNMLLHSRERLDTHRSADINALVDEALNLAYHGARAEQPEFNVALYRDFDPAAGEAELFPQEITRVLLNLISNGFYASVKRKEKGGADFGPELRAATKDLGDRVEIRIRDNGVGIPPEVKEKVFNPFFTTKPPGEGTGLGLSMSHDIIVKQHGGRIEVATVPGQFTEFVVYLPRTHTPTKKTDK